MTLRKIEFVGKVEIKPGKTARYPSSDRLPLPWTGVFVHNLSANYIYFAIDRVADDNNGFPFYDWDWKDFDGYIIRDYISFYGASAATVFIMGYSEWKLTDPIRETKGEPAAPIARRPMVSDPDYGPTKKPKFVQYEDDEGYEPGL